MNQLPSKVLDQLAQTTKEMKVVFEINDAGDAIFIFANQTFVDFHTSLGVSLTMEDVLGLDIQDYFRLYLGFTDDQINGRLKSFRKAIESEESYWFKEISDHPGILVMVLDSIWHPVKMNGTQYMIWESSLETETRF